MSINLITGYAGTAHITAAGDGAVNAGMFGSGKYVLNIGEKFGYEIISNNLIRIKSGYAIDQGRKIELAVNDYEEVEIDNGLQGVKRCDLIVMHYEKSMTTGIETVTMKVIKGTSGDDYTDPAYTSGDIINGANEDDFLLYRVKINGLNIETVESLFSVTDSILNLLKEQAKTISVLNTNLNGKADSSHTHDSRYYTETEINSKFSKLILKKEVSYSYSVGGKSYLRLPITNPTAPSGYSLISRDILTASSTYVQSSFGTINDLILYNYASGEVKGNIFIEYTYVKSAYFGSL